MACNKDEPMLARARAKIKETLGLAVSAVQWSRHIPAEESLVAVVEHSWSDDYGMGLLGWAFSKDGSIEGAQIWVGDLRVPIAEWYPRPDVCKTFPQCQTLDCGFSIYLPRIARHGIRITAEVGGRRIAADMTVNANQRLMSDGFVDGSSIFNEFIALANQRHMRVLEIGSRVVSPGSRSKRQLFPDARRYVGFDYYGDDNTDLVGDAHRLCEYVGKGEFDAVFSDSVFEHLAMPWVVAMEINRVLTPGGITFHSSHFAWPLHEVPWDFWRFSDEGLKVLFSNALGFATLKAGLFFPVRIHPDEIVPEQRMLPLHPAFAGAAILAEKVAEVDEDRFRWRTSVNEILPPTSRYPPKSLP
jgi:SAM-dependent methyltransferase